MELAQPDDDEENRIWAKCRPLARQMGALAWRHWIYARYRPMRTAVRLAAWPSFLLLLCYYIVDQNYQQYKQMFPYLIPYFHALFIFVHMFNVHYIAEFMLKDRATSFKSLLLSMGLDREAYNATNFIWSAATMLPFTLILAKFAASYLFKDSQATGFQIGLMFVILTIQLLALAFALVTFMTKTSHISILFVFLVLDEYMHMFVRSTCEHQTGFMLKFILILAAFSPLESIRIFGDSYLVNKNSGSAVLDAGNITLIAQPTWLIIFGSFAWTVASLIFARWFEEACPWQRDSAVRSPCFCLRDTPDCDHAFGEQDRDLNLIQGGQVTPSKYFEKINARNRQVGIQIDGLTKTFRRIAAVDNVSFRIFRGETTLLLGHNGAGKSTLMNLILGIMIPDSGRVTIKGQRFGRSGVGLCPQTSILDDEMTVHQHLELFAILKSNAKTSAEERESDIRRTIQDIGLAQHAGKRPNELSGGMRRKLSLGIAFIGHSDVLILDEPSSGLDPDSRVFIWNAIRRYRAERTVLLSTQHMEEADYLGDRIAIMSSGRIVCCGSSVFLNRLFGAGYKIRLECAPGRARELFDHIRANFFDGLKLSESTGTELAGDETDFVLSLELSDKSADSELALIRLLEELENHAESLGVLTFGLRSSSIEDVMLETSKHFSVSNEKDQHDSQSVPLDQISVVTNLNLMPEVPTTRFLYALLMKQVHMLAANILAVVGFRMLVPLLGAYLMVDDLSEYMDSYPKDGSYKPRAGSGLLIVHLIYFPVLERTSKFKIMQLTSRVNFLLYWLAQLLFDLLWVILISNMINVMFALFFKQQLLAPATTMHLILGTSYLLFGISTILFIYVVASLMRDPKTAMGYLLIIWSASSIVYFVIRMLQLAFDKTDLDWMRKMLGLVSVTIFPGDAIQYIAIGLVSECYIQRKEAPPCEVTINFSPLKLGYLALVGQIAVYSVLLFAIERNYLDLSRLMISVGGWIAGRGGKQSNLDQEKLDDDVAAETEKAIELVRRASAEPSYSMIAAYLSKSYTYKKKAVDNVALTVKKGECFGLLGINGAGKSTTFSMLATDALQDFGEIFANGYYSRQLNDYRARFGYDPQHCPDLPMTPYQALFMMARLRGLQESTIPTIVETIIELLDMRQHSHKCANKLSGGTKKKLALAMTLVGNPSLVALDEPTAGVDPLARRGIWLLIKALKLRLGSSVIISSHAMEECEAICDRISIMAQGRLRCIGSFLHLRSKFARGCSVRIHVCDPGAETPGAVAKAPPGEVFSSAANVTQLVDLPSIVAELKGLLDLEYQNEVELADVNSNNATLNITNNKLKRSQLFDLLRQFKVEHPNVNYMVNDTSLENIFLTLAREHQDIRLEMGEE